MREDVAVRTGAERIAEALAAAGARVCFGLPGTHNLPLWDALRRSPLRLVGVRHEQTAGYAGDGYARVSGGLGVALTTTGPGAANVLAAAGEAAVSGSPLLVVSTDVPTHGRRPGVVRGALHETSDQGAMFAPVVKEVVRIRSAAALADETQRAIAAALAPPAGPVFLEVPTDLLSAPAPAPAPAAPPAPPSAPAPDAVEAAVALLARAERPLVWAGGGAVDAGGAVRALAERIAAPVLETYGARGLLPPDHPCRVGMPPHVEPAGRLWDEADVVVAIGSDFDGMDTQNWAMPQPPALVAVNVDPADAAKSYRPDVVVQAEAAAGAAALAARLPTRDGLAALGERLRALRAEACRALDAEALAFLDAVAYALPPDAVVVADMCIPGYWLGGFHAVAAPRRLLYPIGWGTLGFAFPAAIGAAVAASGPVVAFCGDGGFLFAPGELATLAQEAIPLTVVVVDDGGYGMLRFDQDRAGLARFGVDLRSPDFAALGAAFGLPAETVDGLRGPFGDALARHVALAAPSLLVARMEQSLPPPPTSSPRWYRR